MKYTKEQILQMKATSFKAVIHVKTKEESDKIHDLLDYNVSQSTRRSRLNQCEDQLCLEIKENCFSRVDYYSRMGYTIIEYDDIIWEEELPTKNFGIIVENNAKDIVKWLEDHSFIEKNYYRGNIDNGAIYTIDDNQKPFCYLESNSTIDKFTIYTLEQLQAIENTLPEKWCILRTKDNYLQVNDYFNNLYPDSHCSLKTNSESWFYSTAVDSESQGPLKHYTTLFACRISGFTEITVEQLTKTKTNNMKKKIIGYIAPQDYFGGDIKKGTTLVKSDYYNTYRKKDYNPSGFFVLPKEIVETWEPVYEEDQVKIVNLPCQGDNFQLEVSKKGIFYRPESQCLDIDDLKDFLSNCNATTTNIDTDTSTDRYLFKVSHIDMGCKKKVPIVDLINVMNIYKALNG